MCLNSNKIEKFKEPKNWVVGYKMLRWSVGRKGWLSQYSQQQWEFAELVEAKGPSTTRFSGCRSVNYKKGIHAWTCLKNAIRHYEPGDRIVKVLLFSVTHHDWEVYRADSAIIIEVVNRQGYREAW